MNTSEAAPNTDDIVQYAVRQLFIGSVPERADDLRKMWDALTPLFTVMPDQNTRFLLDAGVYRHVRFNPRAMRAFWIGSYAAWAAIRVFADSPDLETFDTSRLATLIDEFEKVLESDDSTVLPLPTGVAEPGQYPDPNTDPNGRAAAELATIATAWVLLHEIRHIRHQQEGTGSDLSKNDPLKNHEEEFSCDAFATEFLLEHIDRYAAQQNVDPVRVRKKRQLAIYFALFTLTLVTKDKWQKSLTHPSVQDRMNAVKAIMEPTKCDSAAASAYAAFSALRMLWPKAPTLY